MKGSFILLLAMCQLCLGYLNSQRDLDTLRKFLTRQLDNSVQYGEVCTAPVDVVFVLDRSRSIWGPNFELEKQFVQGMVRRFDASSSRFGVMTWAEGADVMINLGAHGKDQEALIRDIGRITQRPEIGGSTETWAALRMLREQVMTSGNVRPGVKTLVILVTDGASQKKELTASEARKVHGQGITVIAVGIKEKEMDPEELRAIASDPDSEHMFMLDKWEEAADNIQKIAAIACPSNIEGCKHNRPMDLMFSLSGRASSEETSYTFDLVEMVLGKVTLGEGQVQVGLAPRSCPATWRKIALNAHDTKDSFAEDLKTREYSFETGLEDRIGYLARTAFTPSNGGQRGSDVSRVAVVVIDSKDGIEDAMAYASGLTGDGVKLVVIAVGDVTARDVSVLTSNVIHVGSYREMMTIHSSFLKMLCNVQKFSP